MHVDGKVAPLRDRDTINIELALADLEALEKRKDRIYKVVKSGDKKLAPELSVIEKLIDHMQDGAPARSCALDEDELTIAKGFSLLTLKPTIYACNEMCIRDSQNRGYLGHTKAPLTSTHATTRTPFDTINRRCTRRAMNGVDNLCLRHRFTSTDDLCV